MQYCDNEIYTRNYAINLLRINSPYAFTALGSAIALPVKSYKQSADWHQNSAEKILFLQKLRKYGNIIVHNKEKVFPAARFSDRVFLAQALPWLKATKAIGKAIQFIITLYLKIYK